MRSDMFKVIVERPRKGKNWKSLAVRRRFDWDGPPRAGMRAGIGHVSLNENLNPLKRFLEAQVGRPWNKVWSEIAANIDRRNTVQEHIYSHIDDFIAVQVEWRDGQWRHPPHVYPRRSGDDLWQPLYVDPRTALIRRNPNYRSWSRRSRDWWKATEAEIARRRRPLGNGLWHMRLEGEWYEVRLAPLPELQEIEVVNHGQIRLRRKTPVVFDLVLKRNVGAGTGSGDQLKKLYGSPHLYAVSRRQLSKREMAEHGLPRSTDVRQTPGR